MSGVQTSVQPQQTAIAAPLDIGQLVQSPAYELTVSVAGKESSEDAAHRRWMEKGKFWTVMAALSLLFLAALGMLLFSQSVEEKKVAAGALASLISGVMGYAIKK